MTNNDEQAESTAIWSPPEEEVPLPYHTPTGETPRLRNITPEWNFRLPWCKQKKSQEEG